MDFDFKDYDSAEYVLKKNIKIYDKQTTDRYQRSSDMFTLFCRLLGVDEICYPKGDIINYYDFFTWKSDLDTFYHVRYNEYPNDYTGEQLNFDNGMYLHCKWLDQMFYVAHPYRKYGSNHKQYEEDRQFLNHWCYDALVSRKDCEYKRLNSQYSWHNQYASLLYIVGTRDFIVKAALAIEAYKKYVDQYYSA